MNKRRNVIAVLICAVMLLSMFVSSAYVVHEATNHHECSGDRCPICQFIAQLEQVRRGFGMMLLALLLICFDLAVRREGIAPVMAEVSARCTLVGRKIRLNN